MTNTNSAKIGAKESCKKRPITIFNKIEIVIYSIILFLLVLAVLGGIKSVFIHTMGVADFILALSLWFTLFFLPIRYRLRKIFSMPPKELVSTNLLVWSSVVIIIFCGAQTEKLDKAILQAIGVLFLVYFMPKIVSKKAEKIVDKAYEKDNQEKDIFDDDDDD